MVRVWGIVVDGGELITMRPSLLIVAEISLID